MHVSHSCVVPSVGVSRCSGTVSEALLQRSEGSRAQSCSWPESQESAAMPRALKTEINTEVHFGFELLGTMSHLQEDDFKRLVPGIG